MNMLRRVVIIKRLNYPGTFPGLAPQLSFPGPDIHRMSN